MSESFQEIINQMNPNVAELHKSHGDLGQAFSQLGKAATGPGMLDSKTKELMAVVVAVAVRCKPCIAYHMKAFVKHGGNKQELTEALGVTVYMGGGPSLMYSGEAIAAFNEFSNT